MKQKIYFRADASDTIGYGHFIRTLALTDMLKDDFDCTFFTVNPTSYQIAQLESICAFKLLQPETCFDDFLSFLSGEEIVVLDNYFYDIAYHKKIKESGCKLVCIDDRIDQYFDADVVINHVIGVKAELINSMGVAQLLLGTKYSLLRRVFISAMQNPHEYDPASNEVLIAMGGSDFCNITFKIAELLCKNSNFHLNLLIGDSYKFEHELRKLPVHIYKNLSPEQLQKLIEKQKFAITPPSTLAYEICAVGCPLLVGSFVDNHIPVERALSENRIAISCGSYLHLDEAMLAEAVNQVSRASFQMINRQRQHFDGGQPGRFIECFKALN